MEDFLDDRELDVDLEQDAVRVPEDLVAVFLEDGFERGEVRSFRDGRDDYSLTEFVNVLNTGLSTSDFNDRMSYEDIKFQIMKHSYYKTI